MKKKIWKKIAGLLCVFSMVITSSGIEHMVMQFEISAQAAETTEDGIQWIKNKDGTVTVIGYSGNATVVTIPNIIDGKKVTKMGYESFKGMENLEEINLPEELTSIGDYAFDSCSSLEEINLPEGLTSIQNETFFWCGLLAKISFPQGLANIGSEAFRGCDSLIEINLPEGLESIADRAFWGCDSLKKINLPEGLRSIGDWAFRDCRSLTELTLPASVNAIGNEWIACDNLLIDIKVSSYNSNYNSYDNCLYSKDLTELITCPSGKTTITFPEGLCSIGDYAFSQCSLLREINLPEGLLAIGNYAFQSCSLLTKINLPEGLRSIGDCAFNDCKSLTEINLPEGLTNIGHYAFRKCESLTEIILPESLSSIKESTFAGCKSLIEIILPKGLRSIEGFAFAGCESLIEIILPEGLTSISNHVFTSCTTLYVIQGSYAEGYAKENNIPYKYYNPDKINSDEISSSQYSFIFYDEDKNMPISQDIKAIYNNQELENLEGKFVFDPVSGQDILSIEYKNQTYTYNLSAFEQGKTNIVHISVPSGTNTYTMKLYATQPFANLRTGSKIGLNAVLYKNGVIDTSSHQFSLIVSDNNIVTSELYTEENDMNGLAWELTGVREGTVTVTVTDTQTKAAASINLVVDDKAYTYSADYLTSPNFNKYLCTGFMYADSFKQTALDNGDIQFSFNVYNSGYSSGAVEVYDANGKLKSAVYVKKYKENSSLSDFAKDAWSLYCDITSGKLFQYNQESICEKTEVEVIVPSGGSVKLVSDWKKSQLVAAYNMVDIVIGAMKFGDKIKDIFAGNSKLQEMVTASCYKKVTDEVVACQLKEAEENLMRGFASFWESNAVKLFMDNLKDKSFSTITDTMVESILLNNGDGILSQIEKFWNSLGIQMEDVIEITINENSELNSIPFLLDVLGEGLPTAKILKAAFAANELSSYLLNLAYIGKTTDIGSLDIVFKASDNQMYSVGVSAEGDMLNQNDNIVFHSYLIKDEDERFHSIENTVSELGKHFVVYDIGMKKNGEDVPVTGRIKVTMPVPDGFNPYCSRVYWIKEDGTYQFVKTTLEKGGLVFYTDHFSMYAIVEEENISGDVNGNGTVNIKDSALTRRHVAKWNVEIDLDAADVNKDGKVTIKDSALIRRYVAKWGVTLL